MKRKRGNRGTYLIGFFLAGISLASESSPYSRGVAAVLVQSFVEFPLRMPANALYLSVVIGISWVIIHGRSEAS